MEGKGRIGDREGDTGIGGGEEDRGVRGLGIIEGGGVSVVDRGEGEEERE